jgi:hypothetical protein
VIMLVLAFTHHTGVRLAEVGFLVFLFAGGWLAAAAQLKAGTYRIVGGVGLALGAVLLVIAIHWGHFG